ncbi:MAG: phospholipase D-like domain-containing protein [Candidatus Dormibacteria bacterium]
MVLKPVLMIAAIVALAACAGQGQVSDALPGPLQSARPTAALGADGVGLMTDGSLVATRLRGLMENATRSIDAEIYQFDRPDLVAAMVAAADRGVRVRLLMDPTVAVDAATAAAIRAAHGRVWFFPVGPRQIDHVKLLVVDAREAMFGGMNWGARSYLNHDFEVTVHGPAVERLERLFSDDLRRSGVTVPSSDAPSTAPGIPLLATYPDDQVRPVVLRDIEAAKRWIFIEMFAFTDGPVVAALSHAAARGVAVFVLADPTQHPNRRTLRRLAAAGVHCEWYRGGGELLHAKAMVADGEVLVVGSANWSKSGFTRNHELDTELRDRGLAATALARMELDWRRGSRAP